MFLKQLKHLMIKFLGFEREQSCYAVGVWIRVVTDNIDGPLLRFYTISWEHLAISSIVRKA